MKTVTAWISRGIVALTGAILIVTAVTAHGPKEVAQIITGVACIAFAIYAAIRGFAGSVDVGDGSQIIGLIDVSSALRIGIDLAVLGVLVGVSVVSWVV